jgi:hypothetical protein
VGAGGLLAVGGAAGALVGEAGVGAAHAAAKSPLAPAPSTARNSRLVLIRMPPPIQPEWRRDLTC